MMSGRFVALACQKIRAQAYEEDLHDAEITQPQRITNGGDENEDRKALRAEHVREHESLCEAGDERRARRRHPQQKKWDRDHPALHDGRTPLTPTSMHWSRSKREVVAQVKRRACPRPAAARRSRRSLSEFKARRWPASAVTSSIPQRNAALPHTSTRAGCSLMTIGQSQVKDSSAGRPNRS